MRHGASGRSQSGTDLHHLRFGMTLSAQPALVIPPLLKEWLSLPFCTRMSLMFHLCSTSINPYAGHKSGRDRIIVSGGPGIGIQEVGTHIIPPAMRHTSPSQYPSNTAV